MPSWLERNARIVIGVGIAVLLIIGLMMLSHCTRDRTAERQAEQTERSGAAISAAASQAIETIGTTAATERDIDRAVDDATRRIDDAQDPASVRRSVLDRVCGSPSHRNDPACRVR